MANVLFIGESYVKDTSYIDENVDAKLLRSTIIETQDFRILPILGTALFEDLKTKIQNSTLTANDRGLLDNYISKALKYWVLHDGCYIFQFKIMNKAIVKRNSENAEPIDITELDRLMDYFKTRAEFYSERITKYLIENDTLFPLYNDFGDGVDSVAPSKNNYTQGWFLGETKVRKGLDIDLGRANYCNEK